MIAGAALLVLLGLGLFIGGVLTGTTALYWACVGACGLAVVLLVLARLRAPAGSRLRVPDAPARGSAPAPVREPAPTGPAVPAATPVAGERAAGERVGAGEPPAGDRQGRHGAADGDAAAVPPPATAPSPSAATASARAADVSGDPAEEDVEFTDLLLVVDLTDEVLVVDEHPRYHLGDCRGLAGRPAIPLPLTEARTDGFTPCSVCGPDAHLAGVERARKAARRD